MKMKKRKVIPHNCSEVTFRVISIQFLPIGLSTEYQGRILSVKSDPDDSHDEKVGGIIDVERPFHKRRNLFCRNRIFSGTFRKSGRLSAAAFAVIKQKNRNGNEGEHLQHPVDLVEEEEVDGSVDE